MTIINFTIQMYVILGGGVWVKTEFKLNKILEFFRHIHTSRKLNSVIPLPFKNIWIRKFQSKRIKTFLRQNNPVVIAFRCSFFLFYVYNYEKWIKKINPAAKCVFLFADIVETYRKQDFNMEVARQKFDALISFDKEDSKKYNLLFYPHVIPFPKKFVMKKTVEQYDVYFLGKAKNRINILVRLYKKFRQANLKILFEIAETKESERVFSDENFKYVTKVSYSDYLSRCNKSRCLLEVMQSQDHTGYTTRLLEAVRLNKRLISNNKGLKFSSFYKNGAVSVFSDETDIDLDFINKQSSVDWRYPPENYSVESLYAFIQKALI